MPQETPGSTPQTGQAPPAPCPAALACPRKEPREGRTGWKLTFFFQMPFTPGTASYSLLMASLQATAPGRVTAADPRPLPGHLPACGSAGSGGISPRSPRRRSIPAALPHVTGPQYVIPVGATSLLLFLPIDPQQCPSSTSLRAGWVPQGQSSPRPWPRVSPSPQGPRKGEHPGPPGGSGVQESRTVPGDLCPGVEVEGPHGAQHLDAPHVLRGGGRGQWSEQPPLATATSPGQVMERWPGVSEKGPFDDSSRALTPMHGTLSPSTPKCPIARPAPVLRPDKLICVLWLVPPL